MLKTGLRAAVCGIAFVASVGCAHARGEMHETQEHGYDKFEFALIGDVPYKAAVDWKFDNVIDDINAHHKIQWVLHAGDFKTGSTPCSDELFQDRLQRFERFEMPFVYTPGDNEWTDCHRVKEGQFVPLDRLAKLRELFFPVPGETLGQKTMHVETEANDPAYSEFVENVRWTKNHVIFAALHIVGSNNGLAAFDPNSSVQRTQADDDEAMRRIEATVAWIEQTFTKAKADKARGVLLLFQADPGFELAAGSPQRHGFDEILTVIEREAIKFGKPVMLAHGDSHYFRVDKPMVNSTTGREIENITRVETFGADDVQWLRVVVDPKSPEVFTVHQEIIDANKEAQPLP